MAITYVRSATANNDNVDIDCGSADTGRLLVLFAHVEGDVGYLTSVLADGKAMTMVNRVECGDAFGQGELWYIDEDALTTSNGTINIDTNGGSPSYILCAMLFTGVDQTGPIDDGVFEDTSSVSNVAVPNITSEDDCLIVMGSFEGQGGGGTTSWTSPLTERSSQVGSSNTAKTASGIETTGQSNKTYTHVWDQSCNRIGGNVGVWKTASNEEFKDVALKVSVESEPTYKDVALKTSVMTEPMFKDVSLKVSVAAFSLSGVTYDKEAEVLGSVKCFLFKDNQDDTLSDSLGYILSNTGTGVVVFTGIADDDAQYLVVSWKDDSPHVFDVTDHVFQPSE